MTGRRLLAQVNVARTRATADMQGFLAAVDPVNRLAEASAGFVWRLPAGGGHAVTTVEDDGFATVVNVSLWASYESLHAFVYRSQHGGFVRQRARWFVPSPPPSTALWWVVADERPTVEEALARLHLLRRYGPTPEAFPLRRRFDADGRPVTRPVGIDRRR
jgi:hypothetical protein